MVSQFRGCYNILVMIMLFIFFVFFLETPVVVAAAAGLDENPLVDFSSSEELINLAGYGEAKLSTVLVSGTLLCHASSGGEAELHPRPVSGASVAVACQPGRKTRKSNWVRSTTDEYGDFLVDLPSHLHGIPNLEKICCVKVLQLPKNSLCSQAFTGKHKGIALSSIGDGIRTYTAGMIHMRPKTSNTGGRRNKIENAYLKIRR